MSIEIDLPLTKAVVHIFLIYPCLDLIVFSKVYALSYNLYYPAEFPHLESIYPVSFAI